MVNLFQIVNELRDIVQQADKQRLSVWVDQFRAEFPDLADEIEYCAKMPDPRLVLAYLRERDQRFALLGLIPNIEPTIQFLMTFIRERSNDDSNDHPFGSSNALHHANAKTTRPPRRARRNA